MNSFNKASSLISPYENIVIGNFIYGLGLAIGRRAKGEPSIASVSLTQQTPLDPQMGDLMVRFPGVIRLIEFKRSGSKSTKEDHKLKLLRVALSPYAHLQAVSRAVHWYVKSMPTAADSQVPIRVCPYLEMASGGRTQTLADFSNELATRALDPGAVEPAGSLVQEYLDCLARMADGSTASGGGVIVCVSPDGAVNYVALSDLRQLGMQQSKFLALQQQLTHDIEMAQEHERQLGMTHKRDRSPQMER